MKKIGIIGCGWLGFRIAQKLSDSFKIYTTTTSSDKIKELESKGFNPTILNLPDYQLSENNIKWEVVSDLDVIIITVPFSNKNCCVSSLYNKIQNLTLLIGDFKGQMFLMSSTSVYPNSIQEFSEEDLLSDNISYERMIKNNYPQINILRLAGLMGDKRLLCNYNISDVDSIVNHIHYVDVCSVINKMINSQSQSKIYNVVAPIHPTKKEIIDIQKNNIVLEKYDPTIIGRKISSSKLIQELDFTFQYPDPRYFHL